MRIAIVNMITRTPVGGRVPSIETNASSLIFHLARGLSARGLDITLFVSDLYKPQGGVSDTEELFCVKYLPTMKWSSAQAPITVGLVTALRNRFDIVITSEVSQPATLFCLLAKALSRHQKLIVWQEMACHQKMGGKIPSLLFHAIFVRFLLSKFADFFVPRSFAAGAFISNYVDTQKVTGPIVHGADGLLFYPDPSPRRSPWYYIYPARLVPEKNIEQAIDVIAELRRRGYPAVLDVLGSGPSLEGLQKRVDRSGLNGCVRLQTERISASAMRELYARATALLITTLRDNVLVSVVEAIACECPVVISADADISREIEMFELGVVVHDRQTSSYVDALETLGVDADAQKRYNNSARSLRHQFTDTAGRFNDMLSKLGYL